MFWCCSLETSHPRLLPQSPKVCSVHLSLFLFFCIIFIYEVLWIHREYLPIATKAWMEMHVTINFKLVFYNVYVCVFVLSHVQLFATPGTVAHPRLFPWNFPGKNTGVGFYFLAISWSRDRKPGSVVSPALAGRFLATVPSGKSLLQ